MLPAMLTMTSVGASPFLVADHVTVVSQLGATAPERRAAQDLADHLGKITGVVVPVAYDATTAPNDSIVIGPGPVAAKLFNEVDLAKFEPEQLVMKLKGHRLLLAGGRPRGTLYATYRWLQEEAGVRWWTPWSSRIPKNPSFIIGPVNRTEKPAFEARDPFWYSAFNPDWAARNASNSFSAHLDETHGGSVTYAGFVHTFFPLVPPKDHFAAHPEWYSLINGKRTADGAQLCTTNPQLREFVIDQVRNLLKQQPGVDIVSVSQNDQQGPCECPDCKALDDAEGTHAASVISLANAVADAVKDEYPHVAIDTLAYQYTRKAPKTLKPRPNVIPRLCSIECNFAQPLDHPSNASFMQDLRDWSKLTNRLYVWDYVTDFANYVLPFPNYYSLGPNLRLFHQNGVRGVFEEGAYQSSGSEMMEMRAWVLAQLLWNPYQDDKALIREFLDGYYGPAGESMEAYLKLMSDAAKDTYVAIWVGPDAPFFTLDTMLKAEQLMQRSSALTRNDPDLSWRVRQARLSVDYVWLTRWDALKGEADKRGVVWPIALSRVQLAKAWLKDATGPGPEGWTPMTHLNEGGYSPEQWIGAFGN